LADGTEEEIGVDGLGEVSLYALGETELTPLVAGTGCEGENGSVFVTGEAAEPACGFDTVQAGHLEVHEDEVVVVFGGKFEGLETGGGQGGMEAIALEVGVGDPAGGIVIVDYEDFPLLERENGGVEGGMLKRNRKRKNTPFAWGAGDLQLTAENACEAAGDGEAKPEAGVAAREAGIELFERFEDASDLIAVEPDASIPDRDMKLEGSREVSGAGDADAQFDLAAVGELDGVGEEIVKNLAEADLVARGGFGDIFCQLEKKGEPLLSGLYEPMSGHGFDGSEEQEI